jgi:predicted NACHT family NTPase
MPVISLKLSPDGKQQVERVLTSKAWGIEELVKSVGLGEATVKKFRAGKAVERKNFVNLCNALELNWAEVKDPPDPPEASEPSVTDNQNFETQPPIIEGWVRQVRKRCCQKILHQHSKIQLLNQTEVGVDELYVDVWVLDRSPRTFQVSESKLLESFDLRNDRLGLGDRVQRKEGMAVADKNSKLLILGKPGSGKTTFLKHLAVDCCNGKFQPDLIPVLIELRRIRSAEWQLLTEVAQLLETDQLKTKELLKQGRLLILLDGLDEVSTGDLRRKVQAQVSQLSEEPEYLNNRLILTCRTQIIESIPSGFMSVEVADFNDEQVKAFVANWFRASGQTESKIAQQLQAFSEEIQKNPALKELTVTPVLLSLICLVLQDEGELPSQIAALYRKGIRLLLEKWNDRKDIPEWEIGKEAYRQLSIEEKESLLTEIAARKFENPGNFVLFEQADLTRQIAQFLKLSNSRDGEAVLRAIEAQHGLLVERADELWSFSHLTFQEYFTAQWLNQLQQDQGLAEKIADERWKGVVKLAVKSQQPADRLLRLIKRAIDYSVVNYEGLQDFLMWVQIKAESINVPYQSATVREFYFARYQVYDPGFDFAFDFDSTLGQDLASARAFDFEFNRSRVIDNARERERLLDEDLAFTLELARKNSFSFDVNFDGELDDIHTDRIDFDDNLDAYPDSEFNNELDLELDQNLKLNRVRDLDLDRSLILALNRDLDEERDKDRTVDQSLAIDRTFARIVDPGLRIKLRELRDSLLSAGDKKKSQRWWRNQGRAWKQDLRQSIIKYRNVGHEWQFTELQEQSLKQYYQANQFLVQLLNIPGAASDSVRQEIQNNLLLPIATLQQRLPDQYS